MSDIDKENQAPMSAQKVQRLQTSAPGFVGAGLYGSSESMKLSPLRDTDVDAQPVKCLLCEHGVLNPIPTISGNSQCDAVHW